MNFNENKSIYLQIANRICDEIMLGVYDIGNRIPSVRDYASQMEVNANTAVRSYNFLEQQGIIESKRGLGYFVTPESRDIISETRKEEFFSTYVPDFFKHMNMLGIKFDEVAKLYAEHKKQNGENYDSSERHQQNI